MADPVLRAFWAVDLRDEEGRPSGPSPLMLARIATTVRDLDGRLLDDDADQIFCAVFPTTTAALVASSRFQGRGQEHGSGFGVSTTESDAAETTTSHGPRRALQLARVAPSGSVLIDAATAALLRERHGPAANVRTVGRVRVLAVDNDEELFLLMPGSSDHTDSPIIHRQRGNLPIPASTFVGRAAAVDTVAAAIAGSRLITLTGPPGVGKTRLAMRAASEVSHRFADGVWFVDLSQVAVAAQVLGCVARALPPDLGLDISDAAEVSWTKRDCSCLLVIDNCEHVVLEVLRIIQQILNQAPGLCLIVTSRRRLDNPIERVIEVQPMTTGHDASEATDLLRLRALEAGFGGGDLEILTALANAAGGLPLTLELIAGYLGANDPHELLRSLTEHHLGTLTTGGADSGTMSTLERAMWWSYKLLGPHARILFRRLAPFAGFDLSAAQAIAGFGAVAADEVSGLCHQLRLSSLVSIRRSPHGGTRFLMLPSIRDFARERLDETEEMSDVNARFADHYTALAQRLGEHATWGAGDAYTQLDAEATNIDEALALAIRGGKVEVVSGLTAALHTYWNARSPTEGLRWHEAVLEASQHADAERAARLLAGAGRAAQHAGEISLAYRYARESLSRTAEAGLADQPEALICLSLLRLYDNDPIEARDYAERALSLTVEGARILLFSIHAVLAGVYVGVGETDRAIAVASLMYEEASTHGNALMMAAALSNLANAQRSSNQARAIDLTTQALALVGDGFPTVTKWLHIDLAQLRLLSREVDLALGSFLVGLELGLELNDKLVVCAGVEGIAAACVAEGSADVARTLLDATSSPRAQYGMAGRPWDAAIRRQALAELDAAQPATLAAPSLRLHDAVAIAREVSGSLDSAVALSAVATARSKVHTPSARAHRDGSREPNIDGPTLDQVLRKALAPAELGVHRLDRSQTLFAGSAGPETSLVVASGFVKMWSANREGREVIYYIAEAGDPLNPAFPLMRPSWPWNITALTDSELLQVRSAVLNHLILNDPSVGAVWSQATLRLFEALRSRVFEFGALDANSRVAASLLDLAQRFGDAEHSVLDATLPLTRTELAAACGISREALTKAIRYLRGEEWIEVTGRSIRVIDSDSLRVLAERATPQSHGGRKPIGRRSP